MTAGALAEGLVEGDDGVVRCAWGASDPLYRDYHDHEWGMPVADDRRLFEKLCLEGFQSGLAWITILRKRERFREVFAGFDPEAIAAFGDDDVARLLTDAGIVRHRGKIESVCNNARRLLELLHEHGSLAAFVWSFEPAPPERPDPVTWTRLLEMPKTPASVALAKALKRRGWSYVGPTTVYAFMQSMGLVNDHIEGCAARVRVDAAREAFTRPG